MKITTLLNICGGLIILVSLYYVFNNALHYFDFSLQGSGLYVNPFRLFLLIHIFAGTIAILSGPLQFIPFVRKSYVRWHRTLGKVYMISVVIGSLSGLHLAIADNILTKNEYGFGTGVVGLSIAWMLTSGLAFIAIKNQHIGQHKDWMIKSYVVTCGFTIYRLFADLLHIYTSLEGTEISSIMAWSCWSLPLLITDFALHYRRVSSTQQPRINIRF